MITKSIQITDRKGIKLLLQGEWESDSSSPIIKISIDDGGEGAYTASVELDGNDAKALADWLMSRALNAERKAKRDADLRPF